MSQIRVLITGFAILGLAFFALPADAQGAASAGAPQVGGIGGFDMMEAMTRGTSSVYIHLVDATGNAIAGEAQIKLQTSQGAAISNMLDMEKNHVDGSYQVSARAGLGRIDGIPAGEYIVEVSAPGYRIGQQKLTVLGAEGKTEAFIKMLPFDGSEDSDVELGQPNAPVLPSGMRRELDSAVLAISTGKMPQAQSHLKELLKHAPNSPDAHFIAGYYAERSKNDATARTEYEEAIKLFPTHFSAQLSLGRVLLNQRDAAGAMPHLEKALAVGPNSWRGNWLLAEAHLRSDRDAKKAEFYAQRALDVGKGPAIRAQITLALAVAMGGDLEAGQQRLEQFLKDYPNDANADRARQSLAAIAEVRAHNADGISLPAGRVADDIGDLEDVPPEAITGLPKGIDADVPLVMQGVNCTLPQVLVGAALRSREFVRDLERFSARENFIQEDLDRSGTPRNSAHRSFDYVAALQRPRPNAIIMDELRDGSFFVDDIPAPLAMDGIPVIGVIFNEAYAGDFNFSCEGLGQWKGQTAWQVRFEQRADKPARIHDWEIGGKTYSAILKGRAWLSADSYHLLHVETDLAKPIAPIKLEYQHMSIDYAPVAFPDKKSSLRLPVSAQIYYKYRGRFYHQEHDFSDFVLFSTNSNEKTGPPKQ